MQKCMKKALPAAVAAVTIVSASINTAFAWGAGGHMMVAQIAYDRLLPNAKLRVEKLLAILVEPTAITKQTQDFVNASHWADDIKRNPSFGYTGELHFIDFPFSPDGTALPEDEPKEENIVKALDENVAILRSDASDADKATALRFVIHFVGDIHQPLHCATRVTRTRTKGDEGGNGFNVVTRNEKTGDKLVTKLHSYWDNGLGTFPKWGPNYAAPSLEEVQAKASQISNSHGPANDTAWKEGGPFSYMQWAQESRTIANTFVYHGLSENKEPSSKYQTEGQKIAQKRVAWAGYRLAELLNSIFVTP